MRTSEPGLVPNPLMFQNWDNLTFIHWPCAPELLRSLLPVDLTLDLFDQKAWVGLTPFRVVNLRPPMLPSLPWISHFAETNVRTYVRGPDGEPGIWFFS